MELLTEYENVLHIQEIAASEPYESELKMLSGGVSFQLFGYINIISVPRLWLLPAPLRFAGELLSISQRPSCCFFSSLESHSEGSELSVCCRGSSDLCLLL